MEERHNKHAPHIAQIVKSCPKCGAALHVRSTDQYMSWGNSPYFSTGGIVRTVELVEWPYDMLGEDVFHLLPEDVPR